MSDYPQQAFKNWNHAMRVFLINNPIINRLFIRTQLNIDLHTWDNFIQGEQGLSIDVIRKIIHLIGLTYIQFHFPDEHQPRWIIFGKYEMIGEIRYCKYELQKNGKYALEMIRASTLMKDITLTKDKILSYSLSFVDPPLIPDDLTEIPPDEFDGILKIAKNHYNIR